MVVVVMVAILENVVAVVVVTDVAVIQLTAVQNKVGFKHLYKTLLIKNEKSRFIPVFIVRF